MDIYRQVEAILRRAGYLTRLTSDGGHDILSFEDEIVVGFVHVFPSSEALVRQWQGVEKTQLARHARQLRSAPSKAWNVYSVFLTEDSPLGDLATRIDRIEEDFTSTRKIARAAVMSPIDLERALLPLLPLQMIATFSMTDYEARLRSRLEFLPPSVADASMRGDDATETARLAIEGT